MLRIILFAALACSVAAADDKTRAQRLLLTAPEGPLLIDLAIRIDDIPLGVERDHIIAELIRKSDANGDGKTTWNEAAQGGQFELGALQVLAKQNPKRFARRLRLFDEIDNGEVDPIEAHRLWALYTNAGDLVSVVLPQVASPRSVTAPWLFACLDANSDDVLSMDEITNSKPRLLAEEADGDELLQYADLARFSIRATELRSESPAANLSLSHITGGQWTPGVESLLRADAAEDTPLRRSLVARLDADEDGQLDEQELKAIGETEADVTLSVNLGETSKHPCKPTSLSDELDEVAEIAMAGSTLSVRLDSLHVRLLVGQRAAANTVEERASELFTRLDKDQNRYLTLAEVEQSNDNGWAADFASWDADRNDQVTLEELTARFLQQVRIHRRTITVYNTPRRRSLWHWIDTNSDGKLSIREVNDMPRLLLLCDRNRDRQLSLDELPAAITLRLARGEARLPLRRPFFNFARIVSIPAGPEWFIRMDRNGDGDVSPGEFLGKPKDFKRYDQDDDQLIDAEEAAATLPQKRE